MLAPPAFAAWDDTLRQALAMAESGAAQQAFEMLEPLEMERSGDPDYDLVLGIAANQSGHHTRAIFALERTLMVNPNNPRARAELGHALYAVGDNAGAKAMLGQAKSQGVPVAAARTIDQLLQTIDRLEAEADSSLRAYLEGTLGYDDNVNSAPSSKVFGLKPAASAFTALAFTVSGRKALAPRWSLIGSFGASGRAHNTTAIAYDTTQLDGSIGANYRVDRDEYTVALQLSDSNVATVQARSSWSISSEWTHRFDAFRQFNAYFQAGHLTYPQSVRNVDRYVLGASYGQQFRSGLSTYGSAYIGQEVTTQAGVGHLGHTLLGGRVGVQKPFGDTLALFASLSLEDRSYSGPDPLFLTTRHDQQWGLNIGTHWLPAKAWRVTPQWSYLQTASNISTSTFEKQTLSVTARREF
ncbi:tetratricopeptide repeat protein [uncultured Rhodoferax sp.]|uniref:tetratricopeptide repeat protein n=1 Tax=uncultured Rhodoferax sp. TaxID=223188 RepID=UPI0025CF12BA|nr:tetratricopeptide repeat protein [uncultured Rhodoferax sp.]